MQQSNQDFERLLMEIKSEMKAPPPSASAASSGPRGSHGVSNGYPNFPASDAVACIGFSEEASDGGDEVVLYAVQDSAEADCDGVDHDTRPKDRREALHTEVRSGAGCAVAATDSKSEEG